MIDSKIQTLTEEEAVDQIVETVQQAEPASAPFALVLGSGFSYGLVPTARELVELSLPLWIKSGFNRTSFEQMSKAPAEERGSYAQTYWQRFTKPQRTAWTPTRARSTYRHSA